MASTARWRLGRRRPRRDERAAIAVERHLAGKRAFGAHLGEILFAEQSPFGAPRGGSRARKTGGARSAPGPRRPTFVRNRLRSSARPFGKLERGPSQPLKRHRRVVGVEQGHRAERRRSRGPRPPGAPMPMPRRPAAEEAPRPGCRARPSKARAKVPGPAMSTCTGAHSTPGRTAARPKIRR